ncbi:DUF397 domain-containing protein [Streptomyces sp. NPDC029674]|uniref:DUF397 domain-containing protein n=1 Tax=Streptomyces sp. NPDC029674 TaxID=3365297 RepID=UPI00384E0368
MNDELEWFKSSYSDDEGGACLEVALRWFKSSYSGPEGDACLEVALEGRESTCPDVHIRDSKLPASPEVTVSAPAWATFIAAVQPGA